MSPSITTLGNHRLWVDQRSQWEERSTDESIRGSHSGLILNDYMLN